MAGDPEADGQKARAVGLSFLRARARTFHEVRERLFRKGFSEAVIQAAIADLERLKLLDDRELAHNWVASRSRTRPAGTARLALELRRRGIEAELVDEVLAEFKEQLDSSGTAADILRRQRWRYAGLETAKARRRMLDLLARRGYSGELAYSVVERVLEEIQQDDLKRD